MKRKFKFYYFRLYNRILCSNNNKLEILLDDKIKIITQMQYHTMKISSFVLCEKITI